MMRKIVTATVWVAALAVLIVQARADETDRLGGRLVAHDGDRVVVLPTVSTDVSASIDGDLASVTVRQVFENPGPVPLDATYLFPLQEDAGVHAMTLTTGDEVVRAVIRRRDEARATFEAAKAEGRAAALLTQHRPNMFTQEVANLMPGAPVTVQITYVQAVPRVDGLHELVVPTVVGPRYVPGPEGERTGEDEYAPDGAGEGAPGGWSFGPPPALPPVHGLTIPEDVSPERLTFAATIRGGVSLSDVASPSHAVRVEEGAVTLAAGRTIPNRDLILRYALGGEEAEAGLLTHTDERGTFFGLLVTPPVAPAEAEIAPRELVFVLDTSGSMGGAPLEASQAFMEAALRALRPDDAFRIVRFSSGADEFSRAPVEATRRNVRAGLSYVRRLRADGGTEMIAAMERAFGLPARPGRMRIVVFLTDGYVGNEVEVVRRQAELMGASRVYAFGVGTAPNRHLLSEMARRGRGMLRVIDPTEDGHEAARDLARRIDAPLLTDITLDLGEASALLTPNPVPDLFAGEAVRVTGRVRGTLPPRATIRGRVGGREATLPVTLTAADGRSALPVVWARGRIGDLMSDLAAPRPARLSGLGDEEIEAAVTELGLGFDLVTRWTSFVAVSERVANDDRAATRAADVPIARPAGVPDTAYPAATFGGASAPEPGVVGMLALMLAVAGIAARRRSV